MPLYEIIGRFFYDKVNSNLLIIKSQDSTSKGADRVFKILLNLPTCI